MSHCSQRVNNDFTVVSPALVVVPIDNPSVIDIIFVPFSGSHETAYENRTFHKDKLYNCSYVFDSA